MVGETGVITGAGLTIAMQNKPNLIKEKWKAAIPVASAAILLIDKSVKSQIPLGAVPDNIVPALMQVPENGCVADLVMFARLQTEERAFEVKISP